MKYLVLHGFILLLSQCNKYDDTKAAASLTVPLYTETGANTFGCMVNGEPWANFGETYIVPPEGLDGINQPNLVRSGITFNDAVAAMDSIFYVSGELTIQKSGKTIREETMTLTVPINGKLKGVHKLSSADFLFDYENLVLLNDNFYSLARNPFTVTINQDTIEGSKHIVSGMFNGMLYHNPNPSYNQADSLNIVGGVFDVSVPQ